MEIAIVAQLVERHLAKVETAGSSPVYRFGKETVNQRFTVSFAVPIITLYKAFYPIAAFLVINLVLQILYP